MLGQHCQGNVEYLRLSTCIFKKGKYQKNNIVKRADL
jgi:hypothetical protein